MSNYIVTISTRDKWNADGSPIRIRLRNSMTSSRPLHIKACTAAALLGRRTASPWRPMGHGYNRPILPWTVRGDDNRGRP